MACFHPLSAVKSWNKVNGKYVVQVFGKNADGSADGIPIQVPCGQCIGCRLERSREMAVRSVHEASLHQDNSFITLTYAPEYMPFDGGLVKKDLVNFKKRLRKYAYPKKFKTYECGEYGETYNRPHYHLILFGYNFTDWVYLFDSPSGESIYTSPTLEKIWGLGFVTIGTVTFESAAYVARYCMKKINGPKAEEINDKTGLKHYERYHAHTGEIVSVWPEYATMSRGGRTGRGLAYDWISNYKTDCYPKDFTTIRGIKMKPPKYYDRYLEEIEPQLYDDIKAARELSMFENMEHSDRLKAKEIVKQAQFKQLKRQI